MPDHPRAAIAHRSAPLAIIATLIALLAAALGPIGSASATATDVGFIDHSIGAAGTPTGDKPQSQVWFTDGTWFAGMFEPVSAAYHIYRLNNAGTPSQAWADTGVAVDARNASHGDYLWDESAQALYVASNDGDTQPDAILVFKFNYNATTNTYTADPDFAGGLTVGTGPSETITIAKDSTGRLWVTYQNPVDPMNLAGDRKVMVNNSTTNEQTWGTAFQVGSDIGPDDISAIIAFGGDSVGVMWSEHRAADADSGFHFATHADSAAAGTWVIGPSITGAAAFAEDHINLKLVATGSGTVLAALKTNAGPNHIQLYSYNGSSWTAHVVVQSQDVTRPQVVVDETNQRAYVLYTSPESAATADQAIYYKSAPLSTLAFTATGLGTPFIQDVGADINNVTTPKRNVTAASGLLANAASPTNYYHGFLSLGATAAREVVRVSGANRYATAAAVSALRFPSPSPTIEVFVATGLNFPDALSAGPAAHLKNAPILLVSTSSVPSETAAELTRLGPSKITIIGGTTQVSAGVQTQLQAYTDSHTAGSVVRISGANRYATAANVSQLFAVNRPAVFVATGLQFPDALSAGPAASKLGVPILLVTGSSIPAETQAALTRLSPATIYVIGGTSVISSGVQTALQSYTDSHSAASVKRLSGIDRFATNVDVVQEFWTSKVVRSAVANGQGFPDALAEGAYDLPLHLVNQNAVPTVVLNDVIRIDPDRIDALGGTAVISDSVLNTLRNAQ